MQLLKSFRALTLLFVMSLFIASCGGDAAHDHSDADHSHDAETTEAAAHGAGKEYTSAYVCPMHCEGSGSDAAGTCPVCGMDYVLLSEHTADGHAH